MSREMCSTKILITHQHQPLNQTPHNSNFIPQLTQATANSSEMKHLQTGDIDYREATAAAAVRNKIEVGGVTAEQNAATIKVITRT